MITYMSARQITARLNEVEYDLEDSRVSFYGRRKLAREKDALLDALAASTLAQDQSGRIPVRVREPATAPLAMHNPDAYTALRRLKVSLDAVA